jgi:hypothetical protein
MAPVHPVPEHIQREIESTFRGCERTRDFAPRCGVVNTCEYVCVCVCVCVCVRDACVCVCACACVC